MSERTWACEVRGPVDDLPPGSDLPMRMAVRDAFKQVAGHDDTVLRSGWGLSLSGSLDAAWAEAEIERLRAALRPVAAFSRSGFGSAIEAVNAMDELSATARAALAPEAVKLREMPR